MYSELKRFFINESYREMNTNSDLLTVLYKEEGTDAFVLVFHNIVSGIEATREQYAHVVWQIEQAFQNKGYTRVEVLNVICTKNVDRVKEFCVQDAYTHWVIDMNQNRLIIYENQLKSNMQIQRQIEQILNNKTDQFCQHTVNQGTTSNKIQKESWKNLISRYPVVTITLIAVNIIVYILCALTGSTEDTAHLFAWGGSEYSAVVYNHEYYRLIAAMFLHAGPEHLINNMFVLAIIGERLEKILGKGRYLFVYMIAGLLSSIGSVMYYHSMGEVVVGVGASGAIFGIIGGIFYIVLRYHGKETGITPSRMILFLMLSLYSGVNTSSNVDNTAHVVGCISGILLTVIIDVLQKQKRIRRNK